MKLLIAAVGLVLVLVTLTTAEDNKQLTEVQKLKADNLILKSQLAQCVAKTNEINLTIEQQKLLAEFRTTLNAKEGDQFDWQNKVFIASAISNNSK